MNIQELYRALTKAYLIATVIFVHNLYRR